MSKITTLNIVFWLLCSSWLVDYLVLSQGVGWSVTVAMLRSPDHIKPNCTETPNNTAPYFAETPNYTAMKHQTAVHRNFSSLHAEALADRRNRSNGRSIDRLTILKPGSIWMCITGIEGELRDKCIKLEFRR